MVPIFVVAYCLSAHVLLPRRVDGFRVVQDEFDTELEFEKDQAQQKNATILGQRSPAGAQDAICGYGYCFFADFCGCMFPGCAEPGLGQELVVEDDQHPSSEQRPQPAGLGQELVVEDDQHPSSEQRPQPAGRAQELQQQLVDPYPGKKMFYVEEDSWMTEHGVTVNRLGFISLCGNKAGPVAVLKMQERGGEHEWLVVHKFEKGKAMSDAELHFTARMSQQLGFASSFFGGYIRPKKGVGIMTVFEDAPELKAVATEMRGDKQIRYSSQQATAILGQLIFILKTLQDNNVIHRDIKSKNMLIPRQCANGQREWDIKDCWPILIDFGLACGGDYPCRGTPGTVLFKPPEVLLYPHEWMHKGDVFAMGAMAVLFFTGSWPPEQTLDHEYRIQRANAQRAGSKLSEEEVQQLVHDAAVDEVVRRDVSSTIQKPLVSALGGKGRGRFDGNDEGRFVYDVIVKMLVRGHNKRPTGNELWDLFRAKHDHVAALISEKSKQIVNERGSKVPERFRSWEPEPKK